MKKLDRGVAKFALPEVPLDKVPLQPSEKKARGLYQTLIDGFPDLALATEARFELAELLAERNEHDAAVKLLNEALDKEPSADLTEKIRLRLGGIHAAKGNLKAALAQFDAVAYEPQEPAARLGALPRRRGAAPEPAIPRRDQAARRLPRSAALAKRPRPDATAPCCGWAMPTPSSRTGTTAARPTSGWSTRSRTAPGSTRLATASAGRCSSRRTTKAPSTLYSQVTARTADRDLAAKAQLQIGLCRLEQKRYLDAANAFLLVVPSTYDYPELQRRRPARSGHGLPRD